MMTALDIEAIVCRANEIVANTIAFFKRQAHQCEEQGCPLASAEMILLANDFALVFGDPPDIRNVKTANDDYRDTLSRDIHLYGYPID
jgi:hypothetical protein